MRRDFTPAPSRGATTISSRISLQKMLLLMLATQYVCADEPPIYHQSFDEPIAGLGVTNGQLGRAAEFNGVDTHYSIGDLGDQQQITIAVWVRPDVEQVTDGDDYNGLVSSNAWEKGVLHFCYRAGRAQCFAHLGGGSRADVRSPVLPKQEWTHLALVADVPRDRLELYVNGRSAADARGIGELDAIQMVEQVVGGEHVGTHQRYFRGAIDDVRIYDRVLPPGEIASLCPGAPVLTEPTFDEQFRIHAAEAALETADREALPRYHYLAPFGPWMGDVNGPLYHDGWFHVFYQWRLAREHKVCWGHARSRDLIDWEHLPAAIPPHGSRGSWSGGTIVTEAGPRILFTCDYQQLGAVGSDDLLHWQPMERELAMPRSLHTSQDVKIGAWRDPFLWKHDGQYFACVGGALKGQGYVSLYRAKSAELDDWEFIGPLFVHPDSPDNACPNFFRVDNKWVLLMSRHRPHVEDWFVGEWDPETLQFQAEQSGILGYNEATYATQGLYHPDGRVIYWNSIHQWRRANKPLDWPGCLSLPRELSVAEDNTLRVRPLRELVRLRGDHFRAENIRLSDATQVIQGATGDTIEIRLTIDRHDAESVGVVVRRSEDGTRGLELRYADTVYLDGEEALYSIKHGKQQDPVRQPFVLGADEPLQLTIYLDRMCVEAFVNDRICYDRILHDCDQTGVALELPQRNDQGIALFAEGGEAIVRSLDVWQMKPIQLTNHPSLQVAQPRFEPVQR